MARTGRPKAELILSDAERAALEGWVRRRSTPQAWALRCRIILVCSTGASNKDVAAQLGSTPHAVGRWRARFVELTNKWIRRGAPKGVQVLEKDIRTWIAAWNPDPKPCVWTKTADEILERLASYLNRIPDSEDWRRERWRPAPWNRERQLIGPV